MITSRQRRWAHIAGAFGIVLLLASGYLYVFAAAMTVPTPATYVFVAAWLVLVTVGIFWWRRHPRRTLILAIVSIPAVVLALELGYTYLGWGP